MGLTCMMEAGHPTPAPGMAEEAAPDTAIEARAARGCSQADRATVQAPVAAGLWGRSIDYGR